jgi:hypothetical protein
MCSFKQGDSPLIREIWIRTHTSELGSFAQKFRLEIPQRREWHWYVSGCDVSNLKYRDIIANELCVLGNVAALILTVLGMDIPPEMAPSILRPVKNSGTTRQDFLLGFWS